MFVKEKLYTPEGGFVAEVELPAFQTKPEVLIWGTRAFIFVDSLLSFAEQAGGSPKVANDNLEGCYVEAWAYWCPPAVESAIPDKDHVVRERLLSYAEAGGSPYSQEFDPVGPDSFGGSDYEKA